MQGVLDKSGEFLDVSWKLARKREIPDRLLVREDDLERLADAVAEPDAETRARRLARLEPYLSAYPPYWYHMGRTQQSRGRFVEAEQTYVKLASLGGGHFRRDEMLAAGWANTAMIRDHLGRADAADAAERALACSTDVWQVNLARRRGAGQGEAVRRGGGRLLPQPRRRPRRRPQHRGAGAGLRGGR